MRVRCLSLSCLRAPSRSYILQPRRSIHTRQPIRTNPTRTSRTSPTISPTSTSPTNHKRHNDVNSPNTASLLALLRRNPELSQIEAEHELRWIQQSAESADIEGLCTRRGYGEPLQYILGDVDFGPLTILTRAPVLIPRPETAHVITRLAGLINSSCSSSNSTETSLSRSPSPSPCFSSSHSSSSTAITAPSSPTSTSSPTTTSATTTTSSRRLKIADLCSGSGCIALLLSHLIRPRPIVRGFDISQAALSLSRENAQRLSSSDSSDSVPDSDSSFNSKSSLISNPKVDSEADITFTQLDLFHTQASKLITRGVQSQSHQRYDIIVSNPPYITSKEYQALPHSVKAYEDPRALVGDLDLGDTAHSKGLAFYDRIASMLPELLRTDDDDASARRLEYPRIALEIGEDQAQDVQNILLASRCVQRTEVWQDQYGKDRMVVGWTR